MVRRGFQEPDTYDAYDDDGPGPHTHDPYADGDPDADGDGWEPDEDQLAEHRIEQEGGAALAYAADVTVRLRGLRALAEWVCDQPHRRRLAALVVDERDVVLWHEGRTTPRRDRSATLGEAPDDPLDELPTATQVGSLDDLNAIPRAWQDPRGAPVTMTCPGCRRDYTAAPSGGTAAQMVYLGLLDVVELNRLPAVVLDHLRPRRVAPRRGGGLCFMAHRVLS